MYHRHCYEAVNRTLRDMLECDEPFGGKVVVFLGDFRQVLPVVKKGSRFQIVDATLKRSPLWQHVRVRNLTTNMRVELSGEQDREVLRRFADFLLALGDGRLPHVEALGPDWIKLDDHVPCVGTSAELTSKVYGDLPRRSQDQTWLFERAILTPKNSVVDAVNEDLTANFPGDAARCLLSADEVGADDNGFYPIEFLNSLCITGMPPHKLMLKVGMPVMLLRNLHPSEGHCNGTRYVVRAISDHLLDLRTWVTGDSGQRVEQTLLVPRIVLTSPEGDFPFVLRRRQFPVRPAFAMTINKSQGQTLKQVGVLLPDPVFSHGQLYVALSRVGKPQDIVFYAEHREFAREYARSFPGIYTKNVVYREVLS